MPRRNVRVRHAVAALLWVAGVAAHAQPVNTRLEYQVSADGTNWSNSINVLPGETVRVRTLISYVGPGTAAGVSLLIFQPVVSNWHATDALLNSENQPTLERTIRDSGDIPPFGERFYPDAGTWGRIRELHAITLNTSTFLRGHLGTGTAAGLLRISRAEVTNWIGEGPSTGTGSNNNWNGGGGVPLAQIANPSRISTDPLFFGETQNAEVFGFALRLDGAADPRTLSVTTPAAGIGKVTQAGANFGEQDARWFATTTEVLSSLRGGVEVIDAQINVIPAPGGLLGFGLLSFIAARRRS